VSRNEVSKGGSREVAVVSCKGLSINVHGGIGTAGLVAYHDGET
jgi:hypothetical protein